MKRETFFKLFLIFLLLCFIQTTNTFGQVLICGDVDKNEVINIVDALLVAQCYVGLILCPQPDTGDVDCNGNIDIIDALLIARYYVGLLPKLDCCGIEPTNPPTIKPENLDIVRSYTSLDTRAEEMLLENGFVVLGNQNYNEISTVYFSLFFADSVSTFITTDALLHIFHIVYDSLLKTSEKTVLKPEMEQLVETMTGAIQAEYESLQTGSFLKEGARRLWVVFSVCNALLKGEQTISADGTDPIKIEADEHLRKIYEHTVTEFYPGDDYTIYEPRGHYAGDVVLESYFRGVKWISRRIFRVYDPNSVENSEYELAGAAIMAYLLTHGTNEELVLWKNLYNFTSMLVDAADSITPILVDQAMSSVFGTEYANDGYMLLEDQTNRVLLKDELLSDNYPESEIIPVPLQSPGDLPKKYVQFMGERYVIDGEAMQRTCFPDVPDRVLPCGLDVAATVMDSTSAYEELSNEMQLYPGLQEQIDSIRDEFAQIQPDKWQRSTYNYWLYALRSLSADYSGAVCDFMKTSLWKRVKLGTQMASWTELRHDNILYAKQTFVPSPANDGLGIVEPYPEFYERLEGICNQLVSVIDSSGISLNIHRSRLQQLAGWAAEYRGYAEKTVSGIALSSGEQTEIKSWGLHLLDFFSSTEMPEEDPELIADVASSSITSEVLHEAVGKLNPIIIIYTEPDTERVLAAVGYVMSYYELIEQDWNRLNDDEWKRMLEENPPARPSWTSGYIAM